MRRLLVLAAAVSLVLPGPASAGGWASAELLTPPPQRPEAGATWRAEVRVLQHGRRPMRGIEPAVVVSGRRFPARPVPGRAGVYVAEVVLPGAGRHPARLDDGFTNAVPHDLAPLDVRAPAPAGSGAPALPLAGGALVIAALVVAASLRGRRRRGPRAVPA